MWYGINKNIWFHIKSRFFLTSKRTKQEIVLREKKKEARARIKIDNRESSKFTLQMVFFYKKKNDKNI